MLQRQYKFQEYEYSPQPLIAEAPLSTANREQYSEDERWERVEDTRSLMRELMF